MIRCFKKELGQNKIFFKGAAIPFDVQPTNTGVLALDVEQNVELIAFLDDCIAKRKGGVGAIDEATYEAIKKNKTGKVSVAFSPKSRLSVLQVPGPFKTPRNAAEVAADKARVPNGASESSGDTIPADGAAPFIPARGRVINEQSPGKP